MLSFEQKTFSFKLDYCKLVDTYTDSSMCYLNRLIKLWKRPLIQLFSCSIVGSSGDQKLISCQRPIGIWFQIHFQAILEKFWNLSLFDAVNTAPYVSGFCSFWCYTHCTVCSEFLPGLWMAFGNIRKTDMGSFILTTWTRKSWIPRKEK